MIVCLSGFKGSGKDTVANYLIENYNAIRVAFADPLKDSVAEEFGIDRSSLDDPKRKESPIPTMPVNPKDGFSEMIAEFMFKEFRTSRGLQAFNFTYHEKQFYGDVEGYGLSSLYWTPRALAILKGSVNRSVRSDFWTSKAFGIMQAELNENSEQIIVVSDLRYKSEMVQLKERFGDKAVFIRINRFKESPSSDPSERDLDDGQFDYYLDNSKTIEDTFKQIEDIFGTLTY